MSMEQYELARSEGWQLLYKNDRAFPHGESPTAKVISFFCKRGINDPIIDITKCTPPKVWDYDIVVDTTWLEENLNRTLRYKKTWKGDQEIYRFVVLCNYLDQLKSGGYSKGLISKLEFATISPKKKKNTCGIR